MITEETQQTVLLVILKSPPVLPTLTVATYVVMEEILTPVLLVHTQVALNATALAPVTRNRVPRAVTEGLRTRVPVVNLSQELLVLVGVV